MNRDQEHGSSTSDRSVSGSVRAVEISFKILLSRFIMTIHRLPKDLTPTQLLVGHNRLGLDSDLEGIRSAVEKQLQTVEARLRGRGH